MAGVDQIVARDYMTCIAVGVFACHFDSVIHIVDVVSFNQDASSTVNIDSVRIRLVSQTSSV